MAEKIEYNIIDSKGRLLLKDNWYIKKSNEYYDGFILIKNKNGYNYINEKNELLSPNEWFTSAYKFSEGCAFVIRYKNSNFYWNAIKTDGTMLFSKNLNEENYDMFYGFKNNYARVENKNKEWNFITKDGRFLSPNEWYKYECVFDFVNGFARVNINDDMWNYLNEDGELLLPKWVNYVYGFEDDFSKIQNKDGVYQYVDKKGNLYNSQKNPIYW